jgi:hypothetical protein
MFLMLASTVNVVPVFEVFCTDALQKGLYWLQPPAIKANRGHQFKISPGVQFYIALAHQYIRTKAKCIGGPGQYKIDWGDQSFIGGL